jgi:hypothetical protein
MQPFRRLEFWGYSMISVKWGPPLVWGFTVSIILEFSLIFYNVFGAALVDKFFGKTDQFKILYKSVRLCSSFCKWADRQTAVKLSSVALCWEHAKTGSCLCILPSKRNFQQANMSWSRRRRPSSWHRGVETNNLRLLWQPSVFGQDRQTLTAQHFVNSYFPTQPGPVAARSKPARLLRLWVLIPPGAWMSVVTAVCCHVEVSAKGSSLVQRSPTDCDASLCVI